MFKFLGFGAPYIRDFMVNPISYGLTVTICMLGAEFECYIVIGSSDNGSTPYWPLGSLHTLGAGAHINKGIGFL